MIERLVLFGATGDLAGRYLLPALAALHVSGRLPEASRSPVAPSSTWTSRLVDGPTPAAPDLWRVGFAFGSRRGPRPNSTTPGRCSTGYTPRVSSTTTL